MARKRRIEWVVLLEMERKREASCGGDARKRERW
jgi:hypothetical protein